MDLVIFVGGKQSFATGKCYKKSAGSYLSMKYRDNGMVALFSVLDMYHQVRMV